MKSPRWRANPVKRLPIGAHGSQVFQSRLQNSKRGQSSIAQIVKAWLDMRNGLAAPIELLIIKTRDDVSTDIRGAQMSQSNMSRHTKKWVIVETSG
jgi:hypothetical protein